MNTLIRTAEFAAWLEKLRDLKGKARIGGDKATQKRDIKTTREMARNLKE